MEKKILAALAACMAADAGVTVLPRDVIIINTDVRTLLKLAEIQHPLTVNTHMIIVVTLVI